MHFWKKKESAKSKLFMHYKQLFKRITASFITARDTIRTITFIMS